ncbi:protein MpLPR4 [Marchantia polymorpha subsp. ruderalis]
MERNLRWTSMRSAPSRTLRLSSTPQFSILIALLHIAAVSVAGEPESPAAHSECLTMVPTPVLTPFIVELPRIPSIDVSTGVPLTLGAYKISQSVHPELPNTTFYGFGTSQATATAPGPTLEAKRDVATYITFENHITDAHHLFMVDPTIHRAEPPRGGVPMTVHLHGGETESKYDGHPESWFTAAGDTGPTFITRDHIYRNQQPETLLWYHDHTVGVTRLNIVAGLFGLYFIRNAQEPDFLPSGGYEVPLVIQDKQFFWNGSINFPDITYDAAVSGVPNWCPAYMGDVILVNNKAWPYMNVVRGIYRFRIINAANARTFALFLSDSRVKFVQIGTDGGYLWNPMVLDQILLPNAFRVDVLVDFRSVPVGTTIYLNNSYRELLPAENVPSAYYIMKFNVVSNVEGLAPQENVYIPTSMGTAPDISSLVNNARIHRKMTLEVSPIPGTTPTLNQEHWTDPASEYTELFSSEVWDLIHFVRFSNHVIHIHLVNFLVVHFQTFDLPRALVGNCTFDRPYKHPDSCFTDYPQPPRPAERGWKDTINVQSYHVVRIVFPVIPRKGGSYPFDPTAFPGYLWHCHKIDHEDHDMMRPLFMSYPPASGTSLRENLVPGDVDHRSTSSSNNSGELNVIEDLVLSSE